MNDAQESLHPLEIRYPEKVYHLSRVFSDTTTSYKILWFMAIISLLKDRDSDEMRLDDIFVEMAAISWHPVCLFMLSLGRQDKLQHALVDIRDQSGLQPNASRTEIRQWIGSSQQAKARLGFLRRYVPTRFLTPWFTTTLSRVNADSQRDEMIRQLAKRSQRSLTPSPYHIKGDSIVLNPRWIVFFRDNLGVVEAFAKHSFAIYLQARNPSVPGIINKLEAPVSRRLINARRFWEHVQTRLTHSNRGSMFVDIYSGQPLEAEFAVDHFLPWSFVAHDLLWNLTPVTLSTNASKSNNLPDLDLYLPKLVALHHAAIEVSQAPPSSLEHYLDCFKVGIRDLTSMSLDVLLQRYQEVVEPQTQIALNQGFQGGWKLRDS
jgi:hypothetical protein